MRRSPSPASGPVGGSRTPILYSPDWPCTVARSAPVTRTNASVTVPTTRRDMSDLLARGRSARRRWRTPPCITASRGVSRQVALDGGRLLCVSDDYGHRVRSGSAGPEPAPARGSDRHRGAGPRLVLAGAG